MMLLIGFAVTASSPGSVIPLLSDAQLCQTLQRSYARVVGAKMGPVTILQSDPDCGSKILNNRMSVAVSGDQRGRFVETFMANAQANLCQSRDATMLAFRARRWRWVYEFRFADGSITKRQLTCRA